MCQQKAQSGHSVKSFDLYYHFSQSVTRQGVGQALMKEALKIATENGYEVIQCMALSLYTQKICEKLNYKQLFW